MQKYSVEAGTEDKRDESEPLWSETVFVLKEKFYLKLQNCPFSSRTIAIISFFFNTFSNYFQ